MDVVPVEPGSAGAWQHPPFSGAIADGFVWGRGTLDDKVSVLATLEAIELLLADGFTPERTIYLAFGHDEEIDGRHGAAAIAAVLAERGVRLGFTLDEGGIIAHDIVPGVAPPVALIGVAEKGYLSLKLSVEAEDCGHSSMPPRTTVIGRLAGAIHRLESNPMAANLAPSMIDMFDQLADEMPFMLGLAVSNRWLFAPLVESRLSESPSSDAAIRTTTAVTMFNAGVKANVLPCAAEAVVNFRILSSDSVASVTEHVRQVIDDPVIEISRYARRVSRRRSPTSHRRASRRCNRRSARSFPPPCRRRIWSSPPPTASISPPSPTTVTASCRSASAPTTRCASTASTNVFRWTTIAR